MPSYKYPNIDLGAIPIGSAGRAPDRLTILRKNSTRRRRRGRNFEPMIDYKYPTIASGATPIRSAGHAPDEELLREKRGNKFRVHCHWQAPANKLDIYSHRESGFKNLTISAIALAKPKIEEVED
jgi:hypothetical protein